MLDKFMMIILIFALSVMFYLQAKLTYEIEQKWLACACAQAENVEDCKILLKAKARDE